MSIKAGYSIFAHSPLWSSKTYSTGSEAFASLLFKMGLRTIGKRNRSDNLSCHHGFADAYFCVSEIDKDRWKNVIL
jgi:hypothetical protein